MEPDEIAETPPVPPEQATNIDVIEQLAIVTQSLSMINDRLSTIESTLNERTIEPGIPESELSDTGRDERSVVGNGEPLSPETGPTAQEPIKPQRKHWYFRALW